MVVAGGDTVIVHTGDLPYVAAGGAEAEIGSERLTFSDVDTVLQQLLPAASRGTFNRLGAIRYECPPLPDYPGQRFTVVAYREADELWVEIRRDSGGAQEVSFDLDDTLDFADTVNLIETADSIEAEPTRELDLQEPASAARTTPVDDESDDSLALPPFEELWPNQTAEQTVQSGPWRDSEAAAVLHDDDRSEPPAAPWQQAAPRLDDGPTANDGALPADLDTFELDKLDRWLPAPPSSEEREATRPHTQLPLVTQTTPPPAEESEPTVRAVPPRQAVVLPMARSVRNASPEELRDLTAGGLIHLLRTVAARGGSALYIASDAQPLMRVDGEMRPLEGVDPLSAADVETLLLGVMPERTHEALQTGQPTEWISEVPDLGRVRCVSFWDHRGAGGIFRILTAGVVTVEQLGLPREIQALALQPAGLVLIAGPRSSGKSTLISALVDLINRMRRDHVITIENEIRVVHESRGSLISQREIRDDGPSLLAAVGAARREDPDVLAIEELRGDGVMPVVLEAAGSGRLVIAGLAAHSSADTVDRVFDRFGLGQQRQAQLALAETLRGIIVQILLRKPGGGRVAAREVLLNTPAVASLIADGKTSQLALAIEAGRNVGMVSLNESMVVLVKSGAVDASEAYRRTGDRQGLLALLKRHGVDVSLIERLA
jgi:twitching motility protein PilT